MLCSMKIFPFVNDYQKWGCHSQFLKLFSLIIYFPVKFYPFVEIFQQLWTCSTTLPDACSIGFFIFFASLKKFDCETYQDQNTITGTAHWPNR